MRNPCAATLPVLAALLGACASEGPVVPVPPSVRVVRFESVRIAPDAIHFEAQIAIDNRMRAGLDIAKVDWGADVGDRPVFTETFADLHPMRAGGRQTVTFPFRIAMRDIADQAPEILAEEAIRFSFRGLVHPAGFDPVAFRAARAIPLPKVPAVTIVGAEGSPVDVSFTVFLGIRNPNAFPLVVLAIDSYLAIDGTRYPLLRTEAVEEIGPRSSGRIALTMRQSAAKAAGMVWNVLRSRNPRFDIGGSFTCGTPYGVIDVPLRLGSTALAAME